MRLALLDLDVEGAAKLRATGIDCLTVFLTPVSLEVFESRLRTWLTESDATVASMQQQAEVEMAAAADCGDFDHVIENG